MTIQHTGKCQSCENKTPAESWQEVGSQVHLQGGKVGDTHHTFYQCNDCGSAWVKVQDQGGLGGNGTFYHSLTERFY